MSKLQDKRLADKKFRLSFVAANVRRNIAYQLKAMRLTERMSQGQVGKKARKPQNVISRLENPRYGKVSVQTLLELAAAFDVGLIVKFVSYSRLLRDTEDLTQTELVPLCYEKEVKAERFGVSDFLFHSAQIDTNPIGTLPIDVDDDGHSQTKQVNRDEFSSAQVQTRQ